MRLLPAPTGTGLQSFSVPMMVAPTEPTRGDLLLNTLRHAGRFSWMILRQWRGITAAINACFVGVTITVTPFEVRVLLGNLLAGHPTVKKFLLLFFNILNVIIIPHTLWLCEHRT